MSSRSEQIKDRLFECIRNGEVDNKDLVQIFEHIGVVLGLKTKTNFAKSKISKITGRPKTYPAWKYAKEFAKVDVVVFVVDNE